VGGVVIQRVENYLMECVRSGSRGLRTLALLVLTVAGLLVLAIGALVGFMHIAALFMLAAWMGTESLTLPALVLILFMLVLVMYPLWRWRRQRSAKVIAKCSPIWMLGSSTDADGERSSVVTLIGNLVRVVHLRHRGHARVSGRRHLRARRHGLGRVARRAQERGAVAELAHHDGDCVRAAGGVVDAEPVIYGPGPASSAAHCEWRLAVVEAHPADLPAASLHRTLRLVRDVDLLLADTIASVQMTADQRVRATGVLGGLRAVPGGVRGGEEGHRGRGWHREVDGVGGEAVKDGAVQILFIAGSVLIFLVVFGVGLHLAAQWAPGTATGAVVLLVWLWCGSSWRW
jgi:hypothetical protein